MGDDYSDVLRALFPDQAWAYSWIAFLIMSDLFDRSTHAQDLLVLLSDQCDPIILTYLCISISYCLSSIIIVKTEALFYASVYIWHRWQPGLCNLPKSITKYPWVRGRQARDWLQAAAPSGYASWPDTSDPVKCEAQDSGNLDRGSDWVQDRTTVDRQLQATAWASSL